MSFYRLSRACFFLVILLVSKPAYCVTVDVTGKMSTTVKFQDQISISIPPAIRSLTVTIPVPDNEQLFGYSQNVTAVQVVSSRTPDQTKDITDSLGNRYQVDEFKNPTQGTINFFLNIDTATIAVDLESPIPYSSVTPTAIPAEDSIYLKPTDKVQSDDPIITSIAHTFLIGATAESDVTNRIQEFIQRTVTYDMSESDAPDDALYVLKHKKSLCDGWAHLFLALARADGLPARFVGGYNIGGQISYPVNADGRSTLTVSSADEPHSWVEVWFPVAGWVPFEPQASAGFVDSHHLKAWTGTDSDSVQSIVSWTSTMADSQDIPIDETESSTQIGESVSVSYVDSDNGSPNYTTLARRRQVPAASP